VGYGIPGEFSRFVSEIISAVGQEGITWSVHCHDDLGLAVANSLEAVRSGARQVECTVNGIGERAGNASMEEIVMALRTRKDQYGVETELDTTRLYGISGLVSRLTGFAVPRNKAIVGGNAFAHEAGIHQHGMLCNRATYEIMTPEDVGAPASQLVLGKHSGRHAFMDHLEKKGYHLNKEQIQEVFMLFKALCDRKELVTESDLEALVVDEILAVTPERSFVMKYYMVQVGPGALATANVVLLNGNGEEMADAATGNGPVDAAYAAVRRITGLEPELMRWEIRAVTEKADAMGEAQVTLSMEGRQVHGRGASTDVIEASIKAYVNAMNRLVHLISAGKMAQPSQ
jgi:2-isopropylmalate synthase